jgi:hypothetical protein
MIIILTPGKVGSKSVFESLCSNESLKGYKTCNCIKTKESIYHLHSIAKDLPAYWTNEHDKLGHQIAQLYHGQNEINWKFIMGIRDPISTLISAYYENEYSKKGPLEYSDNEFLLRHTSWMQNFIESVYKTELGINLYEQPFDKEKGYSIVDQGRTSTLVYRLDKLDLIFQDAIEQFLSISNVTLLKNNVTIQKNLKYNGTSIKDSYETSKRNFKLPKEQIIKIYNHESVRHFFDEEEIDYFIEKWSL